MPNKNKEKSKKQIREEIRRLKYLLNKEICCPLDKTERWEITMLLAEHGHPLY